MAGERRKLPKNIRKNLYGMRSHISNSSEDELDIRVQFDIYFQDPYIAASNRKLAFDDNYYVSWEPNLHDGPTSARFAVVDYNGDSNQLIAPAKWKEGLRKFTDDDNVTLDRNNRHNPQFRQAHLWAVAQGALEFYEDKNGLGRRIPWGFDGNRLILVPHAGYGKNAFYDRRSKSLQFYYFESDKENDNTIIYTCLSSDIINHEFGHAVLDGIRPHYIESVSIETAAFHEFIGDISAILIILRNNELRNKIADATEGEFADAAVIANVAEQFGKETADREYLRTAFNKETMATAREKNKGAHFMSQVLTGAMWDILLNISEKYMKSRGHPASKSFWHTIDRMQRTAIQPLDLLPPVDVKFRDYALAILRAEELANPLDPHGYRELMMGIFEERDILSQRDIKELSTPHYLFEKPNLRLEIPYQIEAIAESKDNAYRFLDDHREQLFIPHDHDIEVKNPLISNKSAGAGRMLPKHVILQYVWREEVVLDGQEFGEFEGEATSMLCGGTLVLDGQGNVLVWTRKSGTRFVSRRNTPAGKRDTKNEKEAGAKRLKEFLDDIQRRVEDGNIGGIFESEKGLVGSSVPPFTSRTVDGSVRFELTPHLSIFDDEDVDDDARGGSWQLSS